MDLSHRNFLVHGTPVLIATNGGSTFYGSNNDLVSTVGPSMGGWVATNQLPGRDRIDAAPNEVAHDKLEWKLGVQWVCAHLSRLPLLLAGKLARLWLPDVDSPNRAYVTLQLIAATPILSLPGVGWWSLIRRPEYRSAGWLPLRAAVLATVLTTLIFWGSPRFRDAIAPVLMIYAAVGYHSLAARRRTPGKEVGRKGNRVRPTGAN